MNLLCQISRSSSCGYIVLYKCVYICCSDSSSSSSEESSSRWPSLSSVVRLSMDVLCQISRSSSCRYHRSIYVCIYISIRGSSRSCSSTGGSSSKKSGLTRSSCRYHRFIYVCIYIYIYIYICFYIYIRRSSSRRSGDSSGRWPSYSFGALRSMDCSCLTSRSSFYRYTVLYMYASIYIYICFSGRSSHSTGDNSSK